MSAGSSAARSDASPGLAIGVGGSPVCSRVLYGLSIARSDTESAVRGRIVVEERRVDAERHPVASRL